MHFESFRAYDGTLLAAHHAGEGPLPVVLANGLGGTFVAWTPLVEQFRDRCHFYSWDYRGLYRSGRPEDRGTLTIPAQARDLEALVDHFRLERFALAGWSMGVQLALEYFRNNAERIRGMILLNGTYGAPFDTAFKSAALRGLLPPGLRLARAAAPLTNLAVHTFARSSLSVPLAARLRLVDRRIDRGAFLGIAREFAHLDMDLYLQTLLAIGDHDAGDVLPDVERPVLIIAGDRDMMTPPDVTERMVAEMPQAELFLVPRGTHYCLLEYPELVGLRVEKFLRDHFPEARPKGGARRNGNGRAARRAGGAEPAQG